MMRGTVAVGRAHPWTAGVKAPAGAHHRTRLWSSPRAGVVSRSGDQTQEPRSVINWTLTLALQDSESGSVTLLFNTIELSPHTPTKNPPVASGHTPAQIPAPGRGAWGAARPGPVLSASSPAHCPPLTRHPAAQPSSSSNTGPLYHVLCLGHSHPRPPKS